METNSTDSLLLILCQHQARYAVPAENVEEILPMPDITALPRQPGWLRGICNYKPYIVPVLSLRAVCGGTADADEAVCVILRLDDMYLALTADRAEALVPDSGQRMEEGDMLPDGRLLSLSFVMPGEPAVFALDIRKMYLKIENDFNKAVGMRGA